MIGRFEVTGDEWESPSQKTVLTEPWHLVSASL